MVFARTAQAEKHLGQQFRLHSIRRRYLAVVRGAVATQTIESRLVRDRGDGRRGSTPLPNAGKTAITHVRPVERLGDYTLIECRLETGRTHQIRIHLAENGHPLCGEKVYNQPLFRPAEPDRSGAPRLALCAVELGFVHPITGEAMHFEMPLSADLAEFVARLRK
jgi:23S rRNA pseudouridine1911/1915/1917 synthase